MNNRTLIIVADPHLESSPDDVNVMIDFVRTLNPAEHILVFLGDLFHVWVASPRYHTGSESRLMAELARFRSHGGRVYLTVGNRDLFFKETPSFADSNQLPFDAIHMDFMRIDSANGLLMANHGDTVSQQNRQYLMWRKLVRSALAKAIFNAVPPARWKSILWGLEKRIKHTNKAFRNNFPYDEWENFVEKTDRLFAPRLLVVGHFHPENPIITERNTTTGIVMPPWQGTQMYMVLDAQFNYQFRSYGPQV